MHFFLYEGGRKSLSSMKYLLMFISLILLLSCGKNGNEAASPAGRLSQADIYKVKVSPSYPSKNNAITASVKGVNPSNVSYQWFVNDRAIEGATEKVLKYPGLRKKDRVQVKISIKNHGEIVSQPIIVSNTPPEIRKAKIVPKTPRIGEDIKVEAQTFDENYDSVRVFYDWFINGEPVFEDSDTISIDGTFIKRGDRVSVKITPDDGDVRGTPVTLYVIVANSVPDIQDDMQAIFKGRVYTSRVRALDPDNDPMTFALKKGPEGMTIDPQSGVITWEVSEEDKGKHLTTVSVNDGHGGEALVTFSTNITIAPPQ